MLNNLENKGNEAKSSEDFSDVVSSALELLRKSKRSVHILANVRNPSTESLVLSYRLNEDAVDIEILKKSEKDIYFSMSVGMNKIVADVETVYRAEEILHMFGYALSGSEVPIAVLSHLLLVRLLGVS